MLVINLEILDNIEILEGETWDYVDKVPVKGKLFDFNTETNQDFIFSSKGRVFNLNTGRIIGSGKSGNYNRFSFKLKNGENKSMVTHRVIAYTFCNNNNHLLDDTVNHIDGDPTNNSADNLEIISHAQNIRHACETGLMKICPVVQLTKDNEFVKEYDSIVSASKETGIYGTNIIKVCKGKNKTAGKYRWMYKEDYEQLLSNK